MKRKQVVFDIQKAKGKKFQKRVVTIECPELNDVIDLGKGNVVVFKVKGGTFDDIMKAKVFIDQEVGTLAVRILAEAKQKAEKKDIPLMDQVGSEIETLAGLSVRTQFELELIHHNLVEPKLTLGDIKWISDHFPMTITKLSTAIMQLTIEGSEEVLKGDGPK